MADPLTDWMRILRARGVVVARNHLPARWGVAIGARPATAIHYVPRGSAYLLARDLPPLRLEEGEVALLPRGDAHAVVGSPDCPAVPLAEVVASATPFGREHCTTLVCGEYTSDMQADGAPWRALPHVAHFSVRDLAADDDVRMTLALLRNEIERADPAVEALVRHLLDVLFVYLLRCWSQTHAGEGSWLTGLQDPSLAAALGLIHDDPAHPWTVEVLAKRSHLSRAAFARRFTETLGESPMGYVTRWRMTLAARYLTDGKASVAEVASRVGYQSEFSFSRAFKRLRGAAPSEYRRTSGH